MLESSRLFKVVIAVILITFGSVSFGLPELAHARLTAAAQPEARDYASPSDALKPIAEKIDRSLDELYAIAQDIGEWTAKPDVEMSAQAPSALQNRVGSISRWVRAIQDADRAVQAQQQRDRAFYGAEPFPPEALERIEATYELYKTRRDTVIDAANRLGKASTLQEMDVARDALERSILASWPSKPNRAIDPLNLPFRPKEIREPAQMDKAAADAEKPGVDMHEALAASGPPTADDLAQTLEIQFTPELIGYAERYNKHPIRLYEQILSGFKFQPYYGSQKGAQETFRQVAGNDVDLSSLLITLLRISEIPARYARISIDIPVQQALSWVGVTDVDILGNALASSGYPGALLYTGSTVTHYRLTDYTVVKAWIPNKYRGAGGTESGGTWVYLDPTFKQHRFFDGVNMQAVLGIDKQTEQQALQNNIEQHSPYSFNFAPNFAVDRYDNYRAQADAYFDANVPDTSPFGEVHPYQDIIPEKFDVLPVSLPYYFINERFEHSEFPDSLRFKVQFSLIEQDPLGDLFGYGIASSSLRHTFSSLELVGHRVIVTWEPASQTDRNILNASGGITGARPSSVRMRPIIRVDDVVAAQGSSTQLGVDQTFEMRFINPSGDTDRIANDVVVGSYHAVIFDTQGISPEIGTEKGEDLMAAVAQLGDDINNATGAKVFFDRDDLFGEYLNLIGIQYFAQLNAFEKMTALQQNVLVLKEISEAIVTIDLDVSYTFGIPWALSAGSQGIDVDRSVVLPLPRDGMDAEKIRNYVATTGFQASTQEHSVFDDVHRSIFGDQPKASATVRSATLDLSSPSGSAVKLLALANEQGVPIYSIDSAAAWNAVRNELQLSANVRTDIVNAVNAGQNVMVPQRNLRVNNWVGVGYVITNPENGAAAYLISGGSNGGFFDTLEALNNALFSPEGTTIVGGFLAILDIASDFFGILGKMAPFIGIFLAIAGLFSALADAERDGRLCPEAKQILKEFLIMVTAITVLFGIIGFFLGPLFTAVAFIVSIYLTIAVEILKAMLPLACALANLPDFKASVDRFQQWFRERTPDWLRLAPAPATAWS